MGIALEQEAESSTIRLEGAVGIEFAGELKEHLVQALGYGQEIRISLEGVTDLDVTAMQLLWAAERAAKTAGVRFGITAEEPPGIAGAFSDAGFDRIALFAAAE